MYRHNCRYTNYSSRYTQMYKYTIVDIHKCIDTQL